MPTYTIRDPQTGRTLKVRGDSPPTEAELSELFAVAPSAPEGPPPEGGSLVTPAYVGARAVMPSVARIAEKVATSPITGKVVRPAVTVGSMLAGGAGGAAVGDAVGGLVGAGAATKFTNPAAVEQGVRTVAGAVGKMAPVAPGAADAARVAAMQAGTKGPGVIAKALGGLPGLILSALTESGHGTPLTPEQVAEWERTYQQPYRGPRM